MTTKTLKTRKYGARGVYDKLAASLKRRKRGVYKIPGNVSLQRAKWRLHSFLMSGRRPAPPRGKSWHTEVIGRKKDKILVFLKDSPARG